MRLFTTYHTPYPYARTSQYTDKQQHSSTGDNRSKNRNSKTFAGYFSNTDMKLSSSLLLAVSVNLAAAAVHTGSHPRTHHSGNADSWESAGRKQHSGNGGKHDSGVDGHHPGYNMSVAKSYKAGGKAQKASKSLSYPVEEVKSSKSSKNHDKNNSLPVHTSTKATKEMSLSHTPDATAVDPTTPAEESMTTSTVDDDLPTSTTTPEGADTSVLKVIENNGATNVILTGSNGSQQSKIRDENSVNLEGQKQASMLQETRNSGSIAMTSGILVGAVCLIASASYLIG